MPRFVQVPRTEGTKIGNLRWRSMMSQRSSSCQTIHKPRQNTPRHHWYAPRGPVKRVSVQPSPGNHGFGPLGSTRGFVQSCICLVNDPPNPEVCPLQQLTAGTCISHSCQLCHRRSYLFKSLWLIGRFFFPSSSSFSWQTPRIP